MRTIGKRHPRRKGGGDFLSECYVCRAPEVRSKLVRLSDGNLYHRRGSCRGPLAVDLDRANAAGAARVRRDHSQGDLR